MQMFRSVLKRYETLSEEIAAGCAYGVGDLMICCARLALIPQTDLRRMLIMAVAMAINGGMHPDSAARELAVNYARHGQVQRGTRPARGGRSVWWTLSQWNF